MIAETIRNPLSVIAIFAGLADIAATVVLPMLKDGAQERFLWFVIVFPILLVVAFFLTLNFNPTVLYAPSDFKDEENYMRTNKRPTAAEIEEGFDGTTARKERRLFPAPAETAAPNDKPETRP